MLRLLDEKNGKVLYYSYHVHLFTSILPKKIQTYFRILRKFLTAFFLALMGLQTKAKLPIKIDFPRGIFKNAMLPPFLAIFFRYP